MIKKTTLNKVIEDLFPVGRSAEFCNRRLDDIIAQISEVKDKVRKVSSHGNDDKPKLFINPDIPDQEV